MSYYKIDDMDNNKVEYNIEWRFTNGWYSKVQVNKWN